MTNDHITIERLSPLPEQPEGKGVHPAEYWFIVAVDRAGIGYIVDCHPDATAYDMIDGTACDDNGIEHPEEAGLYRLTNLDFYTHKDWETGHVDEWGWHLGTVEALWSPDDPEVNAVEAMEVITELLALVDDFMPNIGQCALQNYERLNVAPVAARKLLDKLEAA